jgi:hypothetical protein
LGIPHHEEKVSRFTQAIINYLVLGLRDSAGCPFGLRGKGPRQRIGPGGSRIVLSLDKIIRIKDLEHEGFSALSKNLEKASYFGDFEIL